MTQQEEQLVRGLKNLIKVPLIVQTATVKSVNVTELTCVVELANETEIGDVRLKAAIDDVKEGLVQIPEADSTVLVAMIGNDISTMFVLMFSKVTEVVHYDGSNGGVPKVVPLVQKINDLENKVNDLITYINGHNHAANGSPPAVLYMGGSLAITVRGDIENTKVKH